MLFSGAETGSTRAIKVSSGARHDIRRYRVIIIVANDNYAFAVADAANDNFVAVEVAKAA